MIYLMSEIALYLIAAGALGAFVGWMLHTIDSDKKADAIERHYKQKQLTLEKNHRDAIENFSQNGKRLRAEVSRLNTNNKALRANINSNSRTLEVARSEIALLSKKLAEYELLNPDLSQIPEIETDGVEFDETMMISDAHNFDSTVIEIKESLKIPETESAILSND